MAGSHTIDPADRAGYESLGSSAAWTRFLESLVAETRPQPLAVTGLIGAERDRAEEILHELLEVDERAFLALARLGSGRVLSLIDRERGAYRCVLESAVERVLVGGRTVYPPSGSSKGERRRDGSVRVDDAVLGIRITQGFPIALEFRCDSDAGAIVHWNDGRFIAPDKKKCRIAPLTLMNARGHDANIPIAPMPITRQPSPCVEVYPAPMVVRHGNGSWIVRSPLRGFPAADVALMAGRRYIGMTQQILLPIECDGARNTYQIRLRIVGMRAEGGVGTER